MTIADFLNCPDCAKRREAIADWGKAWAEWAKDPLRNPRPGSKEWFDKQKSRAESKPSTNT